MEYLDIVNENGEPTGQRKERSLVHQDGDLHRTSHVWIFRKKENGRYDVLLQLRSKMKDSFPGCYDISSAGHIPAGDGFLESALRELKEELGIEALPEDLTYCYTRRFDHENVFHGKKFIDHQVSRVYRYVTQGIQIEALQLQTEEIEKVIWMDFEECLKAVKNNTIKHCICYEELETAGQM